MKKRLQFDFTPEAVNRLAELTDRIGATSKAETVRKALLLLDRVTTTKYTQLLVKDGDRITELLVF